MEYTVSKKRKLNNKPPQTEYDVFVSFRGEDIRDGFLSHLVKAFHQKRIKAFVDEKLEKGDEIWPALEGAIERSFISLIIFSKDYASSPWCLDELVKILDCREKHQRTVIPVFFHVDPTDVRHQTGTYENSFAEHENKSDSTKVQIWRDALKESTYLAGIESSKFQNDAGLIENILGDLSMRLSKHPINSTGLINLQGLVGIGKQIADIEKLLHEKSEHPRVIGIWGMGGIGKTTIASKIFHKLRSEYDHSCFLQNVREDSRKNGIISLKEKLFTKLLGEKDVEIDTPYGLSDYIVRRITGKKVLVVVDDVNDFIHLKDLLGEALDYLGSDSRIIVTTRDHHVLMANKVDDIHEVKELSTHEALELFNLIAFNKSHLEKEKYYKLSQRVVNYASGVPLVLKVLACLLRGRNKEERESQLNKLQKMPISGVYDVMKLSYDDLDPQEKKIFLDLACFFIGLDLKVGDIKNLLKDGENDNSVTIALKSLKDKALVTFSEDDVVSMHDVIREMGWEIVRQENREDPEKRSRLWDRDDVLEVLKNDKGTDATRSIRMSMLCDLKLSPHAFTNMSKLQFLDCHGLIHLPEKGLQSLPSKLRFLRWNQYSLDSLPQNFSTKRLVILDLSSSYYITKLWDGVQNLMCLKRVRLYGCSRLIELPDFSTATNLEVLEANNCQSLSRVHPSIFSLNKLNKLDLSGCISLTSDTHSRPLSYLNLTWCKLVILNFSGSRVEKLWDGVQNLVNLKEVMVQGCKYLRELPDFSKSKNLEVLKAGGCSQLCRVHPSILSLNKLNKLDLFNCSSLTRLTGNAHLSSLNHLNLKGCTSLREFSLTLENVKEVNLEGTLVETLPSLLFEHLEILHLRGSHIKELPLCIKKLTRLQYLDVRECQELRTIPELPSSLVTLLCGRSNMLFDGQLETVCFPTFDEQSMESRRRVEFWNQLNLDGCSLMAIELNARINIENFATRRNYIESYHDDYERSTMLEMSIKLHWGVSICHQYKADVVYMYPRSTIPKQLEYRTTVDPERSFPMLAWLDVTTENDEEETYVQLELTIESHPDPKNSFVKVEKVTMDPRSSFPKWLEHTTTENHIIIDLSSTPPSPHLGFIFCFILGIGIHKLIKSHVLQFKITISDGAGESNKKDNVIICTPSPPIIKSDHVCIVYSQRCSDHLNSIAKSLEKIKIKVQVKEVMLKGFGISLINTSI